jgi:cytochrome c oxidase assembly protein subunit 11
VVYFVSPAMIEDRVAGQIETITLSYTFFDSSDYSGPRDQAEAGARVKGAANSATPG